MKDRSVQLAQLWLRKADHDVITAKQTLLLSDGPTDTACFHAQQAVEKALKALLTLYGIAFPKIHDLTRLLDMVLLSAPQLEAFRERFAEMSAYAIETRYPGEWEEPDRDMAMQALTVAEDVVRIAKRAVSGF